MLQAVAFELAEVVAELVEAVGGVRETKSCQDGFVNLFGGPTADLSAAVQEDLQQTDDPCVMDLDSRIVNGTDGDRESNPLQEREIDVDVEPLCLKTGEPVGDGLELLSDGIQMIESFLEAEVREVVGTEFIA